MLSPESISHYHEKGWLVIEGVFTSDEAERIADVAFRISQAELVDSDGSPYAADASVSGEFAPRKIDQPYLKDPVFQEATRNPLLLEMLEDLLGRPPLLATDQVFMKPPRFGSAKPYHQDNAYFKCDPAGDLITAWIALDDVDESNGCLRYIDGSHREGIIPHTPFQGMAHHLAPAEEAVDLSRESLALVRKGGVVFHHGETLHTSHRNTSDRWRRAYATHWVTDRVTCDSDLLERAYFSPRSSRG